MKRILLLTTVFMMMLELVFLLHRQMQITFIKVIW